MSGGSVPTYRIAPKSADRAARPMAPAEQVISPVAEHDIFIDISRNTFRTRVWLPAVEAAGISFNVRMHDLRHAHASWLLAGGADLVGVMERLGRAQIQTTQRYLHTLPDADDKNPDAFSRIADRRL